jgi:phenylpropionate dioxygenase-like ring-hydroxylating dioxygenase large terminal subunit
MRWTDLVAADQVHPGSAVAVDVGDLELVVWRTHDGAWCVADARCPHQWSHLGVAGSVEGDELVCLSHFWRFGTDGVGCKLAMSGRRDPKADLVVYPCRVTDGCVQAQL